VTASLRDQLQAVYDQHGQLTPSVVVEEARDPDHPLHSRFEWDDSAAGERWRRHQAHELIQSVRVSYKARSGEPRDVRAFHAVRGDSGHGYEPVEKVIRDDIMTKILMQDMQREWKSLKRRYDQFQEFFEMVREDLDEQAA
jgi:hypothetical protein